MSPPATKGLAHRIPKPKFQRHGENCPSYAFSIPSSTNSVLSLGHPHTYVVLRLTHVQNVAFSPH